MADKGKVYRVRGFSGVACIFVGYPKVWEPAQVYARCDDMECACQADEDSEHIVDDPDGEGEWIEQDEGCGRAIVVMVGDDAKYTVDIEDMTEIDELAYCAGCGQIGCTADARDREENVNADE